MEYEEFLKQLDGVNGFNAKLLKDGYNECDTCFYYLIQLRELIGRMKERIVQNDKARDQDFIIMDYFAQHQGFINASAEDSMCSHLKEMTYSLKETQPFIQAREALARGKEDA